MRGRIRKLEARLRYYKRQLKQYKKRSLDIKINDVEDNDLIHPCPDCGKGELVDLDLKYVTWEVCDHCGFKRRSRKNSEELVGE